MCEVLSWSIGLSGYPFMVSRLGLQFVEEVVCEGHVSLHKFDGLEDRVVLVHAHPLSVVLVKVLRVVCRARPTFLFFGGGRLFSLRMVRWYDVSISSGFCILNPRRARNMAKELAPFI